jgi:putative PIN family toxin of toxin-antitoxin system
VSQPRHVIVDPNVYVSAAITPLGACARLIEKIDDSEIVAVSCPHLIEELRRALLNPTLRRYIAADNVAAYCEVVRVRTDCFPDPIGIPAHTADPKDDYLVALALDAIADAIVSGDRDLLGAAIPVTVWSPRVALDQLGRCRPT